jgi:hypothetical protein
MDKEPNLQDRLEIQRNIETVSIGGSSVGAWLRFFTGSTIADIVGIVLMSALLYSLSFNPEDSGQTSFAAILASVGVSVIRAPMIIANFWIIALLGITPSHKFPRPLFLFFLGLAGTGTALITLLAYRTWISVDQVATAGMAAGLAVAFRLVIGGVWRMIALYNSEDGSFNRFEMALLGLAVAAAIIPLTLGSQTPYLRNKFGDYRMFYALGIMGVSEVLLLVAITVARHRLKQVNIINWALTAFYLIYFLNIGLSGELLGWIMAAESIITVISLALYTAGGRTSRFFWYVYVTTTFLVGGFFIFSTLPAAVAYYYQLGVMFFVPIFHGEFATNEAFAEMFKLEEFLGITYFVMMDGFLIWPFIKTIILRRPPWWQPKKTDGPWRFTEKRRLGRRDSWTNRHIK